MGSFLQCAWQMSPVQKRVYEARHNREIAGYIWISWDMIMIPFYMDHNSYNPIMTDYDGE